MQGVSKLSTEISTDLLVEMPLQNAIRLAACGQLQTTIFPQFRQNASALSQRISDVSGPFCRAFVTVAWASGRVCREPGA